MAGGVMKKQGGGGRGRRRGRAQPMAEINITPFVDVMLVLLIIFMVAAPLLTVGGHSPAVRAGGAVDRDRSGGRVRADPEDRNRA